MAAPQHVDAAAPVPGGHPQHTPRAGRDLPVAIAVGLVLGLVVTVPLFVYRPVFVGVVIVAVCYACVEVRTVLRDAAGRRVPLVPLLVGTIATYVAAYQRGSQGLAVGVLLTALAAVGWRLCQRGEPARLRADLSASLWAAGYVVLLTGFAILLTAPSDGPRRVTTFIATVACSDVGGYAVGVLIGRHPMAPIVSPKKSWEGFGGSALACLLAGGIFLVTLFHRPLWEGVVFGLAVAVTATVGDLGASLIKRDLGVKDWGRLLPGHGGLMDRLDSLLATAPVAYLLLSHFVPLP